MTKKNDKYFDDYELQPTSVAPQEASVEDMEKSVSYDAYSNKKSPSDTPEQSSVKELRTVTLLNSTVHLIEGKEYLVVVSNDDPVRAYLVEKEKVADSREEQQVDVHGALEVYDWSSELASLYPDIETVRQNALLSFWKAGALNPGDETKQGVRNNLYNSAYPYRLK